MSDGGNQEVRQPDPSLGGQAVDQGARAAHPAPEERVNTEEDVVETLRRQLADLEGQGAERERELAAERSRAETAERARQQAEERARAADSARAAADQTSQLSTAEARLETVKSSLSMHESQLETLAQQKTALLEEGKFAEAGKIDSQMAKIGGRIAQLEDGKAELEDHIKAAGEQRSRQPQQQTDQRQQQPDQLQQREEWIRGQPALVQQWLRGEHGNRFFTDQAFQNKVAAAARYAQEVKAIPINSAQYIDFIEQEVGLRQAGQSVPDPHLDNGARGGNGAGQPQGRTADGDRRMTTAPAGGSTGGSVRSGAASGGSTEVYLTPQERDMAKTLGVSESEYARNKRDLLNEGLIGPGANNRR